MVVAHPVGVEIGDAISATDSYNVELIALAIAVALRNALSSANSAFVQEQARAVVKRHVRMVVAAFWVGTPAADGISRNASLYSNCGRRRAVVGVGDFNFVVSRSQPRSEHFAGGLSIKDIGVSTRTSCRGP